MEALASIALAGNILQFLELGLSVISKGIAFKRSHDGALKEHKDLRIVIEDLTTSLSQLDADGSNELKTLADHCREAGAELKQTLWKASSKSTRGELFSSYRKALLLVWNEKHLEEQKRRFECLRSEMGAHLQVSMRYEYALPTISI